MSDVTLRRRSIVTIFDRRVASRLEVIGQARVHIATFDIWVDIRDVSEGGICLESPHLIAPGTVHRLNVRTAGGEVFSLDGKVVYCRFPSPLEGATRRYLVGLSFTDDGASGRELTDRVLRAITAVLPVM